MGRISYCAAAVPKPTGLAALSSEIKKPDLETHVSLSPLSAKLLKHIATSFTFHVGCCSTVTARSTFAYVHFIDIVIADY
jgi:hypothetical protein